MKCLGKVVLCRRLGPREGEMENWGVASQPRVNNTLGFATTRSFPTSTTRLIASLIRTFGAGWRERRIWGLGLGGLTK